MQRLNRFQFDRHKRRNSFKSRFSCDAKQYDDESRSTVNANTRRVEKKSIVALFIQLSVFHEFQQWKFTEIRVFVNYCDVRTETVSLYSSQSRTRIIARDIEYRVLEC